MRTRSFSSAGSAAGPKVKWAANGDGLSSIRQVHALHVALVGHGQGDRHEGGIHGPLRRLDLDQRESVGLDLAVAEDVGADLPASAPRAGVVGVGGQRGTAEQRRRQDEAEDERGIFMAVPIPIRVPCRLP